MDLPLAALSWCCIRYFCSLPAERHLWYTARMGRGQETIMSNADLLQVENLGRSFGGFKALEGITASFGQNRVTAVIGPNGAGKSTLFNILSGALRPSTGSVRFKGVD